MHFWGISTRFSVWGKGGHRTGRNLVWPGKAAALFDLAVRRQDSQYLITGSARLYGAGTAGSLVFRPAPELIASQILISIVLFWRHRSNIRNLLFRIRGQNQRLNPPSDTRWL